MSKHPTPWHINIDGYLSDADGGEMDPADSFLQERIVRAVNAYESSAAKAERAVVRAAVKASKSEIWTDLSLVDDAVDRLLAVRAKAKRGAKR